MTADARRQIIDRYHELGKQARFQPGDRVQFSRDYLAEIPDRATLAGSFGTVVVADAFRAEVLFDQIACTATIATGKLEPANE